MANLLCKHNGVLGVASNARGSNVVVTIQGDGFIAYDAESQVCVWVQRERGAARGVCGVRHLRFAAHARPLTPLLA
jgi:hypothetical protein